MTKQTYLFKWRGIEIYHFQLEFVTIAPRASEESILNATAHLDFAHV